MRVSVILIILAICLQANAQQYAKMSRLVREATMSEKRQANRHLAKGIKRERTICALVRTSDTSDRCLKSHNCHTLASWGDIHVADIPLSQLSQLSESPLVQRIEAHEQGAILLDTVCYINRAYTSHLGTDLPQAFTGKGVVMGIMDVGFDLTHPTFYSADMQDYRIRAFWDMLDPDTLHSDLYVGRDYTTPADILLKAHSVDGCDLTHGTHTTGIAAGSGSEGIPGEKAKYRGMAPNSDICLVSNAVASDKPFIDEEQKYKYTTATDILGFKYIFDYAASQEKPCVISFSEGSHEDLYGDCKLFYEVLDSLTGPGRIIVSAAGNESVKLTYLEKPMGVSQSRAMLSGSQNIAYYTLRSSDHQAIRLDFFAADRSSFAYSIDTKELYTLPDSLLTDTLSIFGKDYSIIAAAYPSCYNPNEIAAELLIAAIDESCIIGNNPKIGITLSNPSIYSECFASGGDFVKRAGYEDWNDAKPTRNILFPSSAPSVICVGNSAWRTGHVNYQGKWKSADSGTSGIRAEMSSVGPTMMGLTKPDVMAPGMNIVSSYSSYYLEKHPDARDIDWDLRHFSYNGRTYPWNSNSGTSMSSPVVGGIVALWLEACPTLTPEDVLEVIAATSRRFDTTLTYPNNEYGWGEIDAYAGLLHILSFDKIESISTNRQRILSISTHPGSITLTPSEPIPSPLSIAIYDTNGRLLDSFLLPAGAHEFCHSVNIHKGTHIVQIAGHGSEIIRW